MSTLATIKPKSSRRSGQTPSSDLGGWAPLLDNGYRLTQPEFHRRHGVQEYVVWQLQEQRINWFVRRDAEYETLPASLDGLFCSPGFPGLWLDTAAILADDGKRVDNRLQRGLASAAHRQFVRSLVRK